MKTVLLSDTEADLEQAAAWIQKGEVVGMPTETVYGLAADACNPEAVKKVFVAKGRPADNPLIVHISEMEQLPLLVEFVPDLAYRLAERFWPGPLTMILPKKACIPAITSGGLDTVGIRMPSHPIARRLITLSRTAIAAPSGNRSGYPSPTTAAHMLHDLNGRITAIIDGGACQVGVESTVICFESATSIRILRPGYITKEDLEQVAKTVILDSAILHEIQAGQMVRSPGMKYQHYSPKANVILVEGSYAAYCIYISKHVTPHSYALVFDGEEAGLPMPYFTYGKNSAEQAKRLFDCLRRCDEEGAVTVYVRAPERNGIGLAVYNRLIRAAGFEVIQL
ncbi:MAG: threonylcarbamoyl-AMP synthase [Oscillospiraceae bacterium]|nr:threonylcarbamoyl-AMP synthase [Oscillospiraceae bacterium]